MHDSYIKKPQNMGEILIVGFYSVCPFLEAKFSRGGAA